MRTASLDTVIAAKHARQARRLLMEVGDGVCAGRTFGELRSVPGAQTTLVGIWLLSASRFAGGLSYGWRQRSPKLPGFRMVFGISIMFWCAWSGVVRVVVWEVSSALGFCWCAAECGVAWRPVGGVLFGARGIRWFARISPTAGFTMCSTCSCSGHFEYAGSLGLAPIVSEFHPLIRADHLHVDPLTPLKRHWVRLYFAFASSMSLAVRGLPPSYRSGS